MTNTTTPSLIVMVPSFDAAWQDVDRCMAALHREKIEADRTGFGELAPIRARGIYPLMPST